MISVDEDSLICDLAETYHIHDYKQLPATKVAVFSCGLRENSRIRMKLSGQKIPFDTVLLASMTDALKLIWWSKTKDGERGKNAPTSITEKLFESGPKVKSEVVFDSGEDFERMRNRLLGGGD
ncbi:DUF5361 domain-containing protein [Enterococcus casseliflavus]|uniref:DUF5361 domain-containing protein n=1 Tax=Enterococcus casseliflavus TaxID=37734 RepID=UPI002955D05F|nr:DUF5361 domain-containing protein [Enterococcus casseliflavus]MDV7712895.1 DUF5361 domain-containing protein [Enterococcus casseliflavus]